MNDPLPPSPPVRPSRLRAWLRYGLIALLVLGIVLYVTRRQIGGLLARELDTRLSAAGIFIEWKSAKWVPGPGIRLHGLALYRDAAKQDRLALFDNVTAIKGEEGWDRWDTVKVNIEDSRLTLGRGATETNLDHLAMRLLIEPGKADLQAFQASLQGLRIEATGVFRRTASAASAAPDVAAKPAAPAKGLFDDLNLDGLKAVNEWVKVQPDSEEPVLKVEFHPLPDGGLSLAATLDGKAFQWRGEKWDLMQAAVKTSIGDKPSPVEIDHFRLGHSGQTAELAGNFDPARGVIRIGKFDSGIDVLALARSLAPDAARSLAGVTTKGAWRINGEGEISVDHPENSRWNGSVALEGDLAYAAGATRVDLQKPAFALHMDAQVVSVATFKAGLWAGNLEIPMTKIILPPTPETKPRFETQVTLSQASLQSAMDSFGAAQKQPGLVHFNWKGGGAFELASITGSGALGIREAEFFRIPLLGPLHLVFDKLAPGFGKDVASTLTANHRLSSGTLHIDSLNLDSKTTRIQGNGSIDLSRQYAHLTAKAKLQGIVGMATGLLSALLEVQGDGPVSDMHWKLKNPGAAVIGEAATALEKTGGLLIEGTGGAMKETGKAAKGLLKIPGSLFPRK